MKVVYPICCGVDVHKTFLVTTIIISQDIMSQYSKKRFSIFNNSILQFNQWLIENNCFDVYMESTGKYCGSCLQSARRYHPYHYRQFIYNWYGRHFTDIIGPRVKADAPDISIFHTTQIHLKEYF